MAPNDQLPPILLASSNRKKLAELAGQLAPFGFELLSAADVDEVPKVEETGTTFAENAQLKASAVARAASMWTVADDSGLEVDALAGRPGVYSARYAGPEASDRENNEKLLQELQQVPPDRRTAQFVCHLAVADPSGEVRLQVSGTCRGRIVEDYRGGGGFGYDPLFLVPEYHRTFWELSPAVKSVLSHRARAFQRLVPRLIQLIGGEEICGSGDTET